MNRVTFEMLAKWIAKESGAKIIFDGVERGACANLKTNEICMPTDLKEHNILAALALVMHEGAHLKYSKVIPDDLMMGKISRHILNVMEDIRIDNRNFQVLWNIREFYERLIQDHVLNRKDEIMKEDLMSRCLINAILYRESFPEIYEDEEARKFSADNKVNDIIGEGVDAIWSKDWEKVKEKINEIKKIFKITDEQDAPVEKGTPIIGIGGDQGEDMLGPDGKPLPGAMVSKYMRPGSAWAKGEGVKGPSRDIIGEAAFQDMTREAFKELLNIKEKRLVYEGMRLNTDALSDFFTGETDQLFHEDTVVKIKKSKIAFCLDGSGSMQSELIDKSMRTDTLVRTIRSIINILKELQDSEGLNIKYDVWAFDYSAEKLDPDKWESQYSAKGGGTNLCNSFVRVQDDILNDNEIDGNKMVILATDGEVSSNEIEELRNHILKHGADVKCMVLGIGASLNGTFVETIAGDINILGKDHADAVVMDCIRTMLE